MDIKSLSDRLKANICKVITGKNEVIEKIIIAALCSGHVLLEDIPGTGKTTAAKALAKSIDCEFKRVQFTPDLLPSDVTGINFYDRSDNTFKFRKGAVFTNILLVWKNDRPRLTEKCTRSPRRSWSSQRKILSKLREHFHCPKHSSTVSLCAFQWDIQAVKMSFRLWRDTLSAHRLIRLDLLHLPRSFPPHSRRCVLSE